MKLTEKCGLSSTGGSPLVTPLRMPDDLKSNILKAQAEAVALKVTNRRTMNVKVVEVCPFISGAEGNKRTNTPQLGPSMVLHLVCSRLRVKKGFFS